MPSSYELLFSRKPRTMLPTARGRLQSCHSGKETPKKKNEQNQAKQKQNYDWHSSQGKEILDIMKPIYARDTLSNIWITSTVFNRSQSIREPKTYQMNVRGKVYKRTREHLKPRPTTNITNIPREETLSLAPNTDTTQKRKAIMMATTNKESNTKKSNRIPNHTKRKTTNINSTDNIPATKQHNKIGKGHQDSRKIRGLKDVIQL